MGGDEDIKPHLLDGEIFAFVLGIFSIVKTCSPLLVNYLCKKRISQIPLKYSSFSKMDNRFDGLKIIAPHSNFI